MVAKNKHHIRKKHGPKPWGVWFPADSAISSRKIITIKMRQSLGILVRNGLRRCETLLEIGIVYIVLIIFEPMITCD